MMGFLKEVYWRTPYWLQDALITLYSARLNREKRNGRYKDAKSYFRRMFEVTPREVAMESEELLERFLSYATKESPWYRRYSGSHCLEDFDFLTKKDLLEHLETIATIRGRKAFVRRTGGTTGASMKVYFTFEDIQTRAALLDVFREMHGYQYGMRTAWFSGKDIVTESDAANGRLYRDDLISKIRYFSTFHITQRSFPGYWRAINEFSPEVIVGFPSSVYELCRIAKLHGLKADNAVQVFFPTAETVLPEHREVIGDVLGCRLADQYASSEGAPFILECPSGSLHAITISGVFEIIGENDAQVSEGELVVTSFTTHGTPLVRYRIGDRIAMRNGCTACACGWPFPIVERIDGRSDDFIWSRERGRINLGNLSNATKSVNGINCFQIVQESTDYIDVYVVPGDSYNDDEERKFLSELALRLGKSINIRIHRVNAIPRERSGKFRIVKNKLPPSSMVD